MRTFKHEDRPLQIGDRVLILRRVPDYYKGWSCIWNVAMDTKIGEVLTIRGFYSEKEAGIPDAMMEDGYRYPLCVLRRVG